jgi:hypothetical protein
MIQEFFRAFGLWNSGTLKDYLPRLSRLLEDILLDYKVLGDLSYRHPWTHYSGGYLDRLLRGPLDYSLGLHDTCWRGAQGLQRTSTRLGS